MGRVVGLDLVRVSTSICVRPRNAREPSGSAPGPDPAGAVAAPEWISGRPVHQIDRDIGGPVIGDIPVDRGPLPSNHSHGLGNAAPAGAIQVEVNLPKMVSTLRSRHPRSRQDHLPTLASLLRNRSLASRFSHSLLRSNGLTAPNVRTNDDYGRLPCCTAVSSDSSNPRSCCICWSGASVTGAGSAASIASKSGIPSSAVSSLC